MQITPDIIRARAVIGDPLSHTYPEMIWAVQVLDNAGVFSEIDEATDYDVDAQTEA